MDGLGRLGLCRIAALLLMVTRVSCGDVGSNGRDDGGSLAIGAFNIQVLGTTKVANTDVVDILARILQRYDLVLIQEIRDRTGTAIHVLLDALNSESSDKYVMALSSRLGRSSSKEQYAYFYKPDRLTLLHAYEYNDTASDVFEREPFVAYFEAPTVPVDRFAMIGVHVKPADASEEIEQLVNVYDDYVDRHGNENAIIAGDFNADCNYLSNAALMRSPLRTDARFRWILPDDTDTTLAASDCSYDRFVTAGDGLFNNTQLNKTGAFYFDQVYGLDVETARDVSDHYPIEMYIQGKASDVVHAYSSTTEATTSGCPGRSGLSIFWLCGVASKVLLVHKTTLILSLGSH